MTERYAGILLRMAFLVPVLCSVACIFDTEPAEPGYPSEVIASLDVSSAGEPTHCSFSGSGTALVAAGESALLLNTESGALITTFELGVSIVDLGDTDSSDLSYILTPRDLVPVDNSAAVLGEPIPLGGECSMLSVSHTMAKAYVLREGDSLSVVDLETREVTKVKEQLFSDCGAMAVSTDGEDLFVSDGVSFEILRIDTETWTVTGSTETWNQVIDLFPGPDGTLCCIVEGSNELWFVNEETCIIDRMVTFPAVPLAAATMPDGSYSYASCDGSGLVIVSSSGQVEEILTSFGLPSAVDIGPWGNRAVVCSGAESTVSILGR